MTIAKNIFSGTSIIIICFAFSFQSLPGQDIKKDVVVVKAYQPEVDDFTKINFMPVFNDTLTSTNQFNYTITPARMNTAYQPRKINVAKMSQEPLEPLNNAYLKLGIGNNLTPLGELYINNTRSKENSIGLYLRHYSSDGKVKFPNGGSVNESFSDNIAQLYGKHIYEKSVLSGDIGYFGNKVGFSNFSSNGLFLSNLDQNYQSCITNVKLESLENDSDRLYYSFSGGFDFSNEDKDLRNTSEQHIQPSENHLKLKGQGGKNYSGFYVCIETSYDYYLRTFYKDSTNTVFSIMPSISKHKGPWRFKAGLDIVQSDIMYTYIHANLEFTVAPSVLYAYVGYNGYLEHNGMISMYKLNPYFHPTIRLKNTDHRAIISGGLKGNASSNTHFNVGGSYSKINNQYFFVNQNSPPLSYFEVLYDDIELLKFYAEFNMKASKKLALTANANYYQYFMFKLQKPWHCPDFEATISARYNLRNKILLTSDLYISGTRFAYNPVADKAISLKPFADLNLGIEYRYSKPLSLFIQIKNLTASQYEWWNQYPVQRFQIMGGLTYSL
jgi:hypothetical protein